MVGIWDKVCINGHWESIYSRQTDPLVKKGLKSAELDTGRHWFKFCFYLDLLCDLGQISL